MESLTKDALNKIETFKSNKIIMDFVTTEALEKTASDIREKNGSGTTAKAIELLMIKNEKVQKRVNDYIKLGLVACYMASRSFR